MRRALLAAAALGCLALPAVAQEASHIRTETYAPTRRTTIIGVVNQPTTITFPSDEDVIRIVQTMERKDGDPAEAAWQIPTKDQLDKTPIGNNLPLWPVEPGTTVLTVITHGKDGIDRPYAFRLVARANDPGAIDARDVTFNLLMTSREQIQQRQQKAHAQVIAAHQAAAQKMALERLHVHLRYGDATCHYEAQGKRPNALEPPCPADTGEWTRIHFPGLTQKPAVYVVDPKDLTAERLARQHADGDAIVVEEHAQRLRLRLGGNILDLINTAYDPAGQPANTGTVSPDVVREITQAKAQ